MFIQTVLGKQEPGLLGRTLTHEHFSIKFDRFHKPFPNNHLTEFLTGPIQLENLGFIRQYPYSNEYNVIFNDVDTHEKVLADVRLYKQFGGGTIVENSSHGLQRNLELLTKVSQETGVHVIAGTGHYVHESQNQSTLSMTIEEMCKLYEDEINYDINGVKCGFIGEVGSGWPLHDFERKCLEATGIVQEKIGCGVSLHPGRDTQAPFEIVRLYLEAGGKANKCIMSHLDRTLHDTETLLEFAKLGVYCQFDLFGVECSYYQLNPKVNMPSDGQRIDKIMELIREGYLNQILMSHDIHTKHRLIGFGGHGYSHIINNILPRLTINGLTSEQIDQITINNPANWLKFNIIY